MARLSRSAVTTALAAALVASIFVVPAATQAAAEGLDAPTIEASDEGAGDRGELAEVAPDPEPADAEPAEPPETTAPSAPQEPLPTQQAELAPPATPDAAPEEIQPPMLQPGEDGSRGRNGGVGSHSPGPASAKPAGEKPFAMSRMAGGPLIGDNYPYRGWAWPYPWGANIWDPWNFAYRQCTSFVAWRLRTANDVPFTNQYMGLYRWGDAGQWADSARSVGIRVDNTPEVGAVAWSGPWYKGASEFGHVAWVAQVLDDGNVVIEEYNNGWAGSYGVRTIAPSDFQGYIHIKDINNAFAKAPAPTVSGDVAEGRVLTAKVSGWSPTPNKVTYQWNRNGTPIAGATASTYKLSVADAGRRLTVTATGSAPEYAATPRTSAPIKLKGAPTPPAKSPFVDVSTKHTFYRQIAWMRQMGFSTGTRTPNGAFYDPKDSITREAMAAFLYRIEALESWYPTGASKFVDVPTSLKFYRQITWMGDYGLSTGTRTPSGAYYSPKSSITREAMAAFLYRLEKPKGFVPPAVSPFRDVPTNHRFYREIAWMHASGISTGTRQPSGKPRYDPKDPVSREAMAAFLFRMETNG